MGNCVFKGFIGHGVLDDMMMVKVVTLNGGVMELYPPITVECITNEFPGHGIFRSRRDLSSEPLLHNEELRAGEVYYLLPLNHPSSGLSSSSKSFARQLAATSTPYRMSRYNKNNNNNNTKGLWSEPEVFPRYKDNREGVWKVKLVISPEQLSEILSQESRTEALIESVRTVAKCGNGVPPSVANSDQWSVSSSLKGSMSDQKLGLDC